MNSAIDCLAASLYSALYVDLPAIEYDYTTPYDAKKAREAGTQPTYEKRKRRPREEEIEVIHFLQTWGSTALGFGGVGGQAMTSAYTTVVMYHHRTACVYFAGRHAYTVNEINKAFIEDLNNRSMEPCNRRSKYAKNN